MESESQKDKQDLVDTASSPATYTAATDHHHPETQQVVAFMTHAARERQGAKKHVVMYSLEAPQRLADSPAQPLAQVIHHANAHNAHNVLSPWRRFYEPLQVGELGTTSLTRFAALEAENLRQSWLKLYNSSPGSERLDLDTLDLSFDGVVGFIRTTSSAVQAKRRQGVAGKVTGRFHSLCDTLHSHGAFLKMLPEGNEYISVFTGSLNAVIKASVNHKRIAEDLDEALCDITDNVAECTTHAELFPTPDLVDRVADLYAHIFLFLASYMDDLQRTRASRMWDSFNENRSQKFDAERKLIRDKTTAVRNAVRQGHYAETRDTRLATEQIARDVRVGRQGAERDRADMRSYVSRLERDLARASRERRELRGCVAMLGCRLDDMLENQAVQHQAVMGHLGRQQHDSLGYQEPGLLPFRGHSRSPSPAAIIPYQYTREFVSVSSADLEDFFHRDRVRPLGRGIGSAPAPRQVLRRLVAWAKAADSTAPQTTPSLLWIDGPFFAGRDHDNPLTVLAATVVDFAAESRVPLLSYFCELRRDEALRAGNATSEAQGLVALVTALLRQMVELLLPAFNATDVDLSRQRFARIDGTLAPGSWDESLALLRDMVQLLPEASQVFCVIDGLHWLDDRSTQRQIAQLVEALRESGFRVLLTTSGRAAALRQAVAKQEAVLVDSIGRADEWLSRRDLSMTSKGG